MSSTNRSNVRAEHVADYYITPVNDIITFFTALDSTIDLDVLNHVILDPCSGGDAKHNMSYPEAISEFYKIPQSIVKTIDIREDSLAEVKQNYLETKLEYRPGIIMSNPPFNKAIEFIQKALSDVEDEGYVIMLLRLNFLETKARKSFFEQYMPEYIFVHHKRMSFVEGKGTDSVAYAHYVWHKGHYPEFAKLKVI